MMSPFLVYCCVTPAVLCQLIACLWLQVGYLYCTLFLFAVILLESDEQFFDARWVTWLGMVYLYCHIVRCSSPFAAFAGSY